MTGLGRKVTLWERRDGPGKLGRNRRQSGPVVTTPVGSTVDPLFRQNPGGGDVLLDFDKTKHTVGDVGRTLPVHHSGSWGVGTGSVEFQGPFEFLVTLPKWPSLGVQV